MDVLFICCISILVYLKFLLADSVARTATSRNVFFKNHIAPVGEGFYAAQTVHGIGHFVGDSDHTHVVELVPGVVQEFSEAALTDDSDVENAHFF